MGGRWWWLISLYHTQVWSIITLAHFPSSNLNHMLFKYTYNVPLESHYSTSLSRISNRPSLSQAFSQTLACSLIWSHNKWTRNGIYQRRKVQEVVTIILPRMPSRHSWGVARPPNRHCCDVLHRKASRLLLPRAHMIYLEVTRIKALLIPLDESTAAWPRNRRLDST